MFPEFSERTLQPQNIGKPVLYANPQTSPARYFGLPKTTLVEFRLLTQPCTIIRESTLQMTGLVERAAGNPSSDSRICYVGSAGTGKSHLLLQTVQHCHLQKWVVIYIPRAYATVDSTTTHVYDLRTRTYVQPFFSWQLVQRIFSTNQAILDTLTTTEKHDFGKVSVEAGQPLQELHRIAETDKYFAPQVLEVVLAELGKQKEHPVLLAVDDFQSLYGKTKYKDPHFDGITSYHLNVPRLIMEYAGGRKSFARGAVFGALRSTNTQFPVSNDMYMGLGLDEFEEGRAWSPYQKQRKSVREYLDGMVPLHVPEGLTATEATGLFELWRQSRAMAAEAGDSTFMAAYTQSGGNPREFVWNGIMKSFATPPLEVDATRPFPQLTVMA
ncbi:hypothetical protein CYLTODRAFT_349530 [Cylindrobasidium torrendii FP15055 ss-10]|uniref:Small ribosomal subunit protein mS29 n=1 Tax=Cylindrobasidium torrendii FP15055 ss-10 TaxID=1314674 RepID=A0A0D7BFY7_9AGAR|nr:hypothetical protein CYLTODRAFT_349530 [Cylindrobasidium torrendii FP15055 ss-10]